VYDFIAVVVVATLAGQQEKRPFEQEEG